MYLLQDKLKPEKYKQGRLYLKAIVANEVGGIDEGIRVTPQWPMLATLVAVDTTHVHRRIR